MKKPPYFECSADPSPTSCSFVDKLENAAMVSDRKLALRILRRSPAFALVVVLLLALGISLNNSDKSSPESRHTS